MTRYTLRLQCGTIHIRRDITEVDERFTRTELLYGAEAMRRLADSRVAVFGIGGVGGYVVEALSRSGIGALDLIDNDTVCLSNLNRQIIATMSTLGQYKVDAAAARIKDINPECEVTVHRVFYLPETADRFDFSQYDYVVDAIDTVAGKLAIIENAKRSGIPVISSMGAGNKTDPTAFEVADIYETSVCPLARVMRHELKKRGIDSLKVVYSREVPRRHLEPAPDEASTLPLRSEPADSADTPVSDHHTRRSTPGSTAFVPSVAGLIIAGEIINHLIYHPIK